MSSGTDTTAPTVTSIVRRDPATSPTNANTLKWRVTFNENVKDISDADFAIGGTTASLDVTGSNSVYDVTASGGNLADRNGTVTPVLRERSGHQGHCGHDLTNTTRR